MKITDNINTVAKKIRYIVTRSPAAGMEVFLDTVGRIQIRMNVRKAKSDYPITWDSQKQRHAFFATDGFGKGIPYNRTGDTVWTVTKPFENEIDLFAPHPAGALFGDPTRNWWRSKIHVLTWPFLKDVLQDELAKWPQELFRKMKVVFEQAKNI